MMSLTRTCCWLPTSRAASHLLKIYLQTGHEGRWYQPRSLAYGNAAGRSILKLLVFKQLGKGKRTSENRVDTSDDRVRHMHLHSQMQLTHAAISRKPAVPRSGYTIPSLASCFRPKDANKII